MNDEIMRKMGFGKEVDRKNRGLCATCEKPVDEADLRDEPSRREFEISGLCQACQDEMWPQGGE